ncbi:MAG: nucleotidyltransferase family protein [Promethearchaeota archaeon]
MLGHVNWHNFIPLASYHGVGGLLLYWLKRLGLESNLPTDVRKDLYGIHESFSNIWEDYHEIIKKILRRFSESKIDVVLLKGAQLAYTDYPHFSLRPMEDIDLLVKGSNKLRIIKLMLEMGFNLYHTGKTCDKFFFKGISRREKENTHKPIFVEVHSNLQVPIRLNKSFSVDMDEFWNGSKMEHFDGFSFLKLVPTYNLIYLCAHLCEHYFSRLIWSYDIALLIHRHREEIDWEGLGDLCRRMRARSPVYHSLSLSQELFQTSIPERVLKNLSPTWWRRKIGHFLIRGNLLCPEQSLVSRFKQFLIKVLSIDSWLEAIHWFFIPDREWIKQQYSVKLPREIYSYYLFHPILYLINAIRSPLR